MFHYDPATRSAIDRNHSCLIKRTSIFTDVKSLSVFEYTKHDRKIRFEVLHVEQPRTYRRADNQNEATLNVGALILEPTLRSSYDREILKLRDTIFPETEYRELKKVIRDGVFVVTSKGGERLKTSPDFDVVFASTI